MKKTNFDHYLQEQLADPEFAARFERAGEAWDVALQISELRRQAGLSQKELAVLLHTSQQQISRLESPGYEGHSLSMLRRVAEALHARVRVVFEPEESHAVLKVADPGSPYKAHLFPASRAFTESETMARIAFEKIMSGLEDALAYADGDALAGQG